MRQKITRTASRGMGALPALFMFLVLAAAIGPAWLAAQTTQPAGGGVDENMIRKLLGGESTTLDEVEAVLLGMEKASKKLSDEKSAGAETQKLQKNVLENLDRLIAQARKSTSKPSQKSSVSRRQKNPQRPQQESEQQKNAQSGDANTMPAAGNDPGPPARRGGGGEKAELARGWGYLPGRDREEVMQGFDEEFLSRYREQIMQYYRDLARAAEEAQIDQQDR